MKKSVAIKWVKALRSGKFKQGRDKLQTKDGYCCLGVLCTLAPSAIYDEKGLLKGHTLATQIEVKLWAGMETFDGYLNFGEDLTSLNDRGKSFKYIAKIIEKNWEKL